MVRVHRLRRYKQHLLGMCLCFLALGASVPYWPQTPPAWLTPIVTPTIVNTLDRQERQIIRIKLDERRREAMPIFETFALNTQLFQAINAHRHHWLDRFFSLVRIAGCGWVLVPVLLLTVLYRRTHVWPLLLAVAIETVLVHTCKQLCEQPRPATLLPGVYHLDNYHWYAFPSGDAAMAFTVACALAYGGRPALRSVLYGYALLIAYERIYLGVHFPLDVLAGAIIGILSATIAQWLLRRRRTVTASHHATQDEPDVIAGHGAQPVTGRAA